MLSKNISDEPNERRDFLQS